MYIYKHVIFTSEKQKAGGGGRMVMMRGYRNSKHVSCNVVTLVSSSSRFPIMEIPGGNLEQNFYLSWKYPVETKNKHV